MMLNFSRLLSRRALALSGASALAASTQWNPAASCQANPECKDSLLTKLADARKQEKAIKKAGKDENTKAALEKLVAQKVEIKTHLKNGTCPAPEPAIMNRVSEVAASAVMNVVSEVASSPGESKEEMVKKYTEIMAGLNFSPPSAENAQEFAGTVGFGTIMGVCCGLAVKKAGKAAGVVLGVIFIGLQAGSQAGYLEVKWDKVEKDFMGALDVNKDGKVDRDDAQQSIGKFVTFMTNDNSAATAGTFGAGFLYGLKKG